MMNDAVEYSIVDFFNFYDTYFEKKLTNKRFKYKDFSTLLESIKNHPLLKVSLLGESLENRDINLVKFGKGDVKILLWSQMHGDEPTATMSFFDLFNFFGADDKFNDFRNKLFENITFYFIPLLNPDGAERITRRNAAGIDINRDFLRLQAPESKILKDLAFSINPDFAFNMHDQDFRWSVGNTSNLATISVLAPVCDEQKTLNTHRTNAIKLINYLNKDLQKVIEGKVARYSDDFEPRSFGDNLSKNFATILIESGRYPGDTNKTFTRKLTFSALLSAFYSVAENSYQSEQIEEYFQIPTNGRFLYDLILRKVNYVVNDIDTMVDICINREEVYLNDNRLPFFKSSVEDIGDCSHVKGIEEVDCEGLRIQLNELSETIDAGDDLDNQKVKEFIGKGILFLNTDFKKEDNFFNLPINLIKSGSSFSNILDLGFPANFVLIKDNKPEYVVLNGMLKSMNELSELNINGMVF